MANSILPKPLAPITFADRGRYQRRAYVVRTGMKGVVTISFTGTMCSESGAISFDNGTGVSLQ